MNQQPLTEAEVQSVILKFWDLNASRAPIKAFEEIFDCERIEIRLTETDVVFRGIAGFADHQIGKLIFFDQRFELQDIQIEFRKEEGVAKTKGVWFASTWQSPAPYSHQLIADLDHTWTVIRCARTGRAVILLHVCDHLKYRVNHRPIDAPKDFHLTVGR